MRRVPSAWSVTRPASLSTFRCWDTAGLVTGSSAASCPTAIGCRDRRSKIARLVGSPSALSAPTPLVFTNRKSELTNSGMSTPNQSGEARGLAEHGAHGCGDRARYIRYELVHPANHHVAPADHYVVHVGRSRREDHGLEQRQIGVSVTGHSVRTGTIPGTGRRPDGSMRRVAARPVCGPG